MRRTSSRFGVLEGFFRDNIRPEVGSDVLDIQQVGVDVRVKLGDSRSNRFQDI